MNFLLYDTKYFLSSKSKEEIKSLILNNSSVPKFHIKNFFLPPYQEDKLLCTFTNYSFRLRLLTWSNYSKEYKVIIKGNIVKTKDGTIVKIKARPSYLYISILIFFAIPLSIGIVKNIYIGHYFSSILCAGILTTMYLFNYFLFKYESVRIIHVFSRLLTTEKPFLNNALENRPVYFKP